MPERLLPGPGREGSWPKSGHVASQTFSHNIHDSAQVILFSSSDVRKAICSLAKEVMRSASTDQEIATLFVMTQPKSFLFKRII